jgi:hypothetical protein
MRRRRARWLSAGVVLAALCGAGIYLHVVTSKPKPLPSGSSRIVLYQVWVGHERYTEGSRSYLTVSASAGGSDTFGYVVMHTADPVFSKLIAPGRYTVKSWQRPCDSNCDNLSGRTDRCQRTVILHPNQSSLFVIQLAPGHGCRIVRQYQRAA